MRRFVAAQYAYFCCIPLLLWTCVIIYTVHWFMTGMPECDYRSLFPYVHGGIGAFYAVFIPVLIRMLVSRLSSSKKAEWLCVFVLLPPVAPLLWWYYRERRVAAGTSGMDPA